MSDLSSKLSARVDMKSIRKRFINGLLNDINKIERPAEKSHWREYYDTTDKDVLDDKKRAVSNVLDELKPHSVLDMGANFGEFSMIAAMKGIDVVAFDSDHDSIDALYRTAKEKDFKILPIVMNLLDPSPGIGWCNMETRSLF